MSIKIGDTVKLIDKFYEHEAFKVDMRWIRKQIASLENTELEVKDINKYSNRVLTGEIDYSIPIELLEKVETDRPVFEAGKSYVFDKTRLERKSGPDSWESDIDGKIVEFIPGNTKGSVGFYVVERKWCREVEELPNETVSEETENLVEAFAELIKPVVEMARDIVEKLVEIYGVDLVEIGKRIEQGMSFQEAIESMSKHRYTDEQVAEAQRIIGEIVADMAWRYQITFASVDGNIIALSWRDRYSDTKEVFEAKCLPTDEYNETIGKMVCLCRAAGRKLPDWIWE